MKRVLLAILLIFLISKPVIAELAAQNVFHYSLDTFSLETPDYVSNTVFFVGYNNRGVLLSVPVAQGDVFTLTIVEPAIYASGSPIYYPDFGSELGNASSIYISVGYISSYCHIDNGKYRLDFADGIDASGFIINTTSLPDYFRDWSYLYGINPRPFNTSDSVGFDLDPRIQVNGTYNGKFHLEYFTSNGVLKEYTTHRTDPYSLDMSLKFVVSSRLKVKIPYPLSMAVLPLLVISRRKHIYNRRIHKIQGYQPKFAPKLHNIHPFRVL